ncbi:hypothetical protein [Enterobacillus tribolii]|nr:hypothetical protein [Enterobacillus tribolii]
MKNVIATAQALVAFRPQALPEEGSQQPFFLPLLNRSLKAPH